MNALRLYIWLAFITGSAYPLFVTVVANLVMPYQAKGSFIQENNRLIGSKLIGQEFKSKRYFWGRPSAHSYDPMQSGGSNYGPTSHKLKKLVDERQKLLMSAHEIQDPGLIPGELLYASGSGLDPHISPATARFQAERVARSRGLRNEDVEKIIVEKTEKRGLGFLGEEVVNVLLLNQALDQLEAKAYSQN